MKVTKRTYNILKNFYGINKGMVFQKGKEQSTICPNTTIIAKFQLDEDNDESFAIYDLSVFLGNLNMLENPTLTLGEGKKMLLEDDTTKIEYYSVAPNLVLSPPDDVEFKIDDPDIQFTLPSNLLAKAKTLASINGSDRFAFERVNNKLYISVYENKNSESTKASILINETEGDDFSYIFAVDTISKILDDEYVVSVKKGEDFTISSFVSSNVVYFIPVMD